MPLPRFDRFCRSVHFLRWWHFRLCRRQVLLLHLQANLFAVNHDFAQGVNA